ncbi:enhanced intracellular survival protein Eis [Pseudonocardia ailaonensis]|uniref:Enhanced intracellular survival protein Eis n=1 Tax=Pseudonocardia ailaonensis TaxID=367279 RepID=A0ABN2NJ94_9PSEU
MTVSVRRATDADFDAVMRHDERGFGNSHTPGWVEGMRRLFDMDRFLLGEVDGELAGIAGSVPFPMGVPGGQVDVEGVTWVSVLPTHRRRGVLRALMHAQLRGFAESGVTVAALMASQSGIYGRFGYGAATECRDVRIECRAATFRPEVPDPGGVRMVEADEPGIREVQRRWAAATPAGVLRHDVVWDLFDADPPEIRGGGSILFRLLHADGYASYRMDHARRTLVVRDFFAVTDEAHVALWRVLLGNDLVEGVETAECPLGDPLPFLLTDPRQVRTTRLRDGVWARLLDPAAALAARRYAVDVDLVLDIHDPVLPGPTRVHLTGGPDGATCAPTTDQPDASLGSSALGALYLGGQRAAPLARARLIEASPQVVRHIDAAFPADRSPVHGTDF